MTAATGSDRCNARASYRRADQAEFVARLSSVELARGFVREVLVGFPALDDVVWCASELAANAVRYGSERGDRFWLVARQRCLRAYVAVIDCGGSTVPEVRVAGPDDEGFRGLALVEALATTWGTVRTRTGGYRVWFEVVAK